MKTCLSLALYISALFAADAVHCQSAIAILSGSPSQGGGQAKLALIGTVLKTDVYFANLDAPSTGAYILCCDADPARATPVTKNLIDTVSGNTFGSSIVDFDTNQVAFWNGAFIISGDVIGARSRLSSGLASGQAYFVVTSNSYLAPPGEIGGTLALQVTTISMRTPPGQPYGMLEISPDGPPPSFKAASGNNFRCSSASQRCVFPVYVSSTYDANKVAITCEARVDFGVITVPPHRSGKPLRVVWQLVEGDIGDDGDYRFMDAGIDLAKNDPRQDFNGKGRESADGKRFKWLRVGTRAGWPIDYNAWVERFDATSGRSLPCQPADPRIANTN